MLCHKQRMFPLGTRFFIFRDNFPAVWIVSINKNTPCTHIYHRLYGKHHSWNQEHTSATITIMIDFWFFMELQANTMTSQVFHDTIAASIPISKHSLATRTSCSFSGVVFPMINIREASA